jgi:hypothetical protein
MPLNIDPNLIARTPGGITPGGGMDATGGGGAGLGATALGIKGLLAGLMAHKQQPPGQAPAPDMSQLPSMTDAPPPGAPPPSGAPQTGLLGGLGNSMLQQSGIAPMMGAAGQIGQKLGFDPAGMAAGGGLGGAVGKLLQGRRAF